MSDSFSEKAVATIDWLSAGRVELASATVGIERNWYWSAT
jgi:hypothetical protein